MSLTEKQKRLLDYITDFQAKNGFGPSQQEIARYFGFRSLGTVQRYLVLLREQGILRSTPHSRRGLEVVPKELRQPKLAKLPKLKDEMQSPPEYSMTDLPVLGKVAAGRPIEAFHQEQTVSVPAFLMKKSGRHFVLKVAGDSMIGDGILDGDWIVVRKQSSAERGELVVARVDGAATVKRFYREDSGAELRASNRAYRPIWVRPEQEFEIEGIVAGVLRAL